MGLAGVAGRQCGVVSISQLRGLGISKDSIRRRLASGGLHPIHQGVYAVGHPNLTEHGRFWAAVLAGGPGAVLSHHSAASLWGIAGGVERQHVTTPQRGRCGGSELIVHRVRQLRESDHTLRQRIPVTTVARTLLDLGEVSSFVELERAAEVALRLNLLRTTALEEVYRRSHGRHGLKPLRQLIRARATARTRSELERRFLHFCRKRGMPAPLLNVRVAGLEVDCLWPRRRVIAELDGWAFHDGRVAFERDRSRSLALEAAGYRVLRITWSQLHEKPAAVEAALRRQLEPTPA